MGKFRRFFDLVKGFAEWQSNAFLLRRAGQLGRERETTEGAGEFVL